MKTNKINPAVKSFYQLNQLSCMHWCVVETAKHDVFKRQATLVSEIVLL